MSNVNCVYLINKRRSRHTQDEAREAASSESESAAKAIDDMPILKASVMDR